MLRYLCSARKYYRFIATMTRRLSDSVEHKLVGRADNIGIIIAVVMGGDVINNKRT